MPDPTPEPPRAISLEERARLINCEDMMDGDTACYSSAVEQIRAAEEAARAAQREEDARAICGLCASGVKAVNQDGMWVHCAVDTGSYGSICLAAAIRAGGKKDLRQHLLDSAVLISPPETQTPPKEESK